MYDLFSEHVPEVQHQPVYGVGQSVGFHPDITPTGGNDPATEVAPITVTAPSYVPSADGAGWDVSMSPEAAGGAGGGNVAQVLWQEHEVAAAQYMKTHVHVYANITDPHEKAIANALLAEIYANYFNALNNPGQTLTDPAQPSIEISSNSVLTAMQAMTWSINESNPEGSGAGYTTFLSGGKYSVDLAVGGDLGGAAGFPDFEGEGFAVNHELGHALGGKSFEQACAAAFTASNPGLTPGTSAWTTAWTASTDFADNEAHANSIGRDASRLLDSD